MYECTTTHQQQAVSSLLSTSHNHSSFQQCLAKVNRSHIDVQCPQVCPGPTINFSFQDLKDHTTNIVQPEPKAEAKQAEQLPVLAGEDLEQIFSVKLDTLPDL